MIEFSKALVETEESIQRGQWSMIGVPVYRVVLVRCPLCSKTFTGRNYGIPRGHTIASDGTLSPSLVCPFPPCTFHEFVRLLDWVSP